MKEKRWCALILCICLLCGCASHEKEAAADTERTENTEYVGMAMDTAELNYEFTPMRPGVLTDQVGYETDSAKIVFFRGNDLTESFDIIDAENGQTVYSGTIEYAGSSQETGESISYGTFTGLVEEGTYYIKTSVIGESYSFRISDALYEEVFRSSCLAFEKLWDTEAEYHAQNLCKDAETIGNLLIAYEYYTSIFQDNLGVSESGNGIPDLLDIIKGRVDDIMTVLPEELTYEQAACYAGILAQFAQDFKTYDAAYASVCLSRAQEAFTVLDKIDRQNQDQSYYFYAAAQLYRALGYGSYHTLIKKYLNQEQDTAGAMDFYGKTAYMSCKYTVDTELCNDIMTSLMEEVEGISAQSSKALYLVYSEDIQEICEEMPKLAVVNYVITNHEYVTVQENHLHYLLGRNAQGISYIAGAGQLQSEIFSDSITGDCYQNSALILMMCEIVLNDMTN